MPFPWFSSGTYHLQMLSDEFPTAGECIRIFRLQGVATHAILLTWYLSCSRFTCSLLFKLVYVQGKYLSKAFCKIFCIKGQKMQVKYHIRQTVWSCFCWQESWQEMFLHVIDNIFYLFIQLKKSCSSPSLCWHFLLPTQEENICKSQMWWIIHIRKYIKFSPAETQLN